MGQAKQRGTLEQRQLAAHPKKKQLNATERNAATLAVAAYMTGKVLRKIGFINKRESEE